MAESGRKPNLQPRGARVRWGRPRKGQMMYREEGTVWLCTPTSLYVHVRTPGPATEFLPL